MQKPYITEYFNVCGLPVVAIKTMTGELAQVWAADKEAGKLRRAPDLMDDVESDNRTRRMLKTDFDTYCRQHRIDASIPERLIAQTLSLFQSKERTDYTVVADPAKPINGFRLAYLG